tara:strand:+ start:347 stop:547 length:201 start_codon:yes stop_codon:yes gene_type:complete
MTSIIKNNAKENIATLQKNLATNESKKISAAMSSEVNEFSGDTNKKTTDQRNQRLYVVEVLVQRNL